MTTPAFPTLTSDDPYLGSWQEEPVVDPTIRTPRIAGYRSTRTRFTSVPRKFQWEYTLLSQADKVTLEIFERDTVKYGSLAFTWQNFQEAYGADEWTANTVYTAGQIVKPVTANGRSYRCTIAGTSHAATEPVWPTSNGLTIADNTVTWTENTRTVRFSSLIKFSPAHGKIDYWSASISMEDR